MPLSRSITVPISLALVTAAVLLGYLWWQLERSSSIISNGVLKADIGSNVPAPVSVQPNRIDDESLFHLRQGDVFALRGEWEEAQLEYQASVEADGGLPALRKLAQAQLQRRDIEGVRKTIEILKSEGVRAEDLLLLESIVDLRTGELVQARTVLQAAVESPQKHYGLALLSIAEGNHTAAQSELSFVIGGWEPVLRSYAKTIQGAYEEFALFPNGSDMHLTTLLSRALAQVQECELALPLINQVTQMKDDYRDAWIVQGYCELTTERPEQALTSLERAYAIDPLKPEVQYFLARTNSKLGNHANAITFLEYAAQNGFQPVTEIQRLLAHEALESGNLPLAIAQYDLLTQEPSAPFEIYANFVTAALAANRNEEAYVKAVQATEKFTEDARAFELLGIAAKAADKKEEAKTALEKALKMDPTLKNAKEALKDL